MDKGQWQKKRPAAADGGGHHNELPPGQWVDEFTLAIRKQAKDARAAWGPYLASFRWQIYIVLTTASRHPTFPRLQWHVHQLLVQLQQSFPRLTAFVSYDCGKAAGRPNMHVFLGGLFLGKPPKSTLHRTLTVTRAIEAVKRAWTKGMVKKIEPYDTRGFMPDYLAKHCNDPNLIGEFFGRRPIKKKKQRRPGARRKKSGSAD